jgi:CDP-6-deoxy-D-xylo-4-hexulose-3-dehydrase
MTNAELGEDDPLLLRDQILELVARFHAANWKPKAFVPGQSFIPYAGRVFDERELALLVESSLDFWLTTGRFAARFERAFADFFGMRHCMLVNSGSSANLVALSALTSPELGDRRLVPGDEVITGACGFPTTINPIVQNRLVPVFLDADIPTYNLDVRFLEAALTSRTRAVMAAHTLGNPFDLATVSAFCKKHDLFLIEDNCDAVGSTFDGRLTGTWGEFATVSFYPAHHMTMGEGGAVLTNRPKLKVQAESFRDWGRSCYCPPGEDNTCGKRFEWQLGELPAGYDHKYTYAHIGYNLKVTDMQAAIGVAQLEKLPEFIAARRSNFAYLMEGIRDLEEFFVLAEATVNSSPSWFGLPLAVRQGAPFSRREAAQFLESRRIATRELFGGNLTRQPAFLDIECRKVGNLYQADFVMSQVFWIGVYPGLTPPMMDWMIESWHALCHR